MTGSFKKGERFDKITYTCLHSIERINFKFNSKCDTDFYIHMGIDGCLVAL